jgi:hypothetical protein
MQHKAQHSPQKYRKIFGAVSEIRRRELGCLSKTAENALPPVFFEGFFFIGRGFPRLAHLLLV